jgi:hypothetical protein
MAINRTVTAKRFLAKEVENLSEGAVIPGRLYRADYEEELARHAVGGK